MDWTPVATAAIGAAVGLAGAVTVYHKTRTESQTAQATSAREDRVDVIDTDVTGWNLVFRVRDRDNSSTVFWELTHSGMTLDAGTQSTISVPIGTANSGTINEGVYEYVLQRTNAGSVRPLALGEFKVKPSAYTT